ncbi:MULTISPECIES: hypothetical protein [Bacteria]|jgi:hypothetical protein|uniref:Uncharacterized protein n=1 Tax=Merismopedia glauca CCAP 1448/3 TaxID=1296344 RepID=A0A2T1C5N4_9CYAN|nr:hypothetical protein [Merismopedia glauca]PSB03592.1 hypothetical protein C7B64_07565 [Merismopedia glauca CCAP 1448/3]
MKAFISRVLFEFNGFNPEVIERLRGEDQFKLVALSIWALAGTLLCALSIGYIVSYAAVSVLSGVISFFIAFFVLVSLNVLLVTTSGMESNLKPLERKKWQPSKFRPLSYFMVGLLFSQPILLAWLSLTDQLESNVSIRHLDTQIESISNQYKNYSAQKNLRLIQLETYRNLADKNAPNVTAKYVKKAILIDDGDSKDTLEQLKNKLVGLGFDVTSLSKVYGVDLDAKIKSYYDNISAGDISLFVYRGPSKVTSDHSLELTPPNAGMFSHSVDTDSLISIVANKKPLASYFLFSLSASSDSAKISKTINWENQESSYVMSLSNDERGELVESFLKNLNESVELNNTFRTTASEFASDEENPRLYQSLQLQFPILLTWGQGQFYKEMSRVDMDGMLPAGDYCKTYSGFEQSTFAKCLEAEEGIVKSELQFIDEMLAKNVQSIEEVKTKKLQNPSILFNYTGWFVKHVFLAIILSLFVILFVGGPYIYRDYINTGVILRYELKSIQFSRVSLHKQFRIFRTVIRNIRNRFIKEGEPFDETAIQHPLYKSNVKERKKKPNSTGDDLYRSLREAIKNNKRSSL